MRIAGVIAAGIALAFLSPGAAHAKPEKVVAFGDSITHGGGSAHPGYQSWPRRIGARRAAVPSGCLVTSADLCVGHLRPALDTYGRVVLNEKPDVVIVAYGMNDLIHSTPREILAGIREVKDRNEARGVDTYVATLTPISYKVFGLNPYRVELNDLIRTRFAKWRVIDFDAALISKRGHLPARFDSGDNLHPNARAYRVMARMAKRALAVRPRRCPQRG